MSRDKQIEYKISKESVDKLFPKEDIDILGYESPIQVFIGQMHIAHERTLESEVIKAIRGIDVAVDKEELIKALQYDKGYINGYNAKASEVAEEIFAEIDEMVITEKSNDGCVFYLDIVELAELKKKYIESEKGNDNT